MENNTITLRNKNTGEVVTLRRKTPETPKQLTNTTNFIPQLGQALAGNIPGAISNIESTRAIQNPQQGFKEFMGLGAGVGTVTNPFGTLAAGLMGSAMQTPLAKQASQLSQGMVSKIPEQMFRMNEPIFSAIGTAGELARKTTSDQYHKVLTGVLSTIAFGSMKNLDSQYKKWAGSFISKIGSGNHEQIMSIPQDAKDLTKNYIGNIKNDIKTWRDETSELALDDYKPINKTLNNLYEGSGKAERAINKAILPQYVMDDLGNIIKESPPKANLGFVYKIKDALSKNIKWDKDSAFYLLPEQIKMRAAYFDLDNIIKDTVGNVENFGKEAVSHYEALNSVAEQAYDLSRSVNKMTKGISKTIPAPEKILQAVPGTEKWQILQQISELEPRMADLMSKISKLRITREAQRILKWTGVEAGRGAVMGGIFRGILGR